MSPREDEVRGPTNPPGPATAAVPPTPAERAQRDDGASAPLLTGPDDRPRPQRVEVVIPVRTLLVLLLFGLLVVLAIVSLGTLLSILLAAVLALGLDPPVAALVRRGWGRGRAALVLFAALFVSVFALVILSAGPVWDEIVEFFNALPAMWEELTSKPVFQELISTAGADDAIREALKDLAAGLPEAANTLLGIAGGVFGSVLSLVTLTFLSLFLLMERPTITEWLFGFTPPPTEKRWRPVVEDSISAVSSSLIGNVAISIVAATVAGVSAWAFGLPFPIVLAVITGLLDLIPQVGATIAAVILVAVALTVSTPAAIAMVVIQLIYQQLENYVVYPIVYRRAVELSGFTTIVAVLIAGSLLGVVGAILAVPFAAVIKVVLREALAPRRARMATLREPEKATEPG
jgi:predicted PurR-regulated permease PerM